MAFTELWDGILTANLIFKKGSCCVCEASGSLPDTTGAGNPPGRQHHPACRDACLDGRFLRLPACGGSRRSGRPTGTQAARM